MATTVNINLLREQQAAFDAAHTAYLKDMRSKGVRRTARPVAAKAPEPVLIPKERERTFEQWSMQRDRELYKPYSWMTCEAY